VKGNGLFEILIPVFGGTEDSQGMEGLRMATEIS
jgi:hypothetical protein